MLQEYKYQATTATGRAVQGTIHAKNKSTAKQNLNALAAKHKLTIKTILPKRAFFYTVKLAGGKKLKGKQTAFTKQEVSNALAKIGYRNTKIEPVLFDIKMKPPFASILMFVNLSSFMLKEKMSYDKILRMLAEDETNPTLKDTLKKIEGELKKGKEGSEVFGRYSDVFGKFPAYMLGLATKSGNMAEVYDATAKFMEREMEFKKNIKQALLVPAFTIIALLGAVLFYVIDIFPATAELFLKFDIPLPPMTDFTLKLSAFLQANWWWMALIFIVPGIAIFVWWRTPKGMVWRDKFIIGIPVIGHLMHKSSIEIFFRVFSAIYSGAENNIETLRASSEACRNAFIEKGIKEITIPLMLKEGMSLVPALEKAEVFNKSTLNRLKTGTETGNILQSAVQIAIFYEKETTYKMKTLIESIQVFIGAYIGIVITALTLVSAEIATISPPTPGV